MGAQEMSDPQGRQPKYIAKKSRNQRLFQAKVSTQHLVAERDQNSRSIQDALQSNSNRLTLIVDKEVSGIGKEGEDHCMQRSDEEKAQGHRHLLCENFLRPKHS